MVKKNKTYAGFSQSSLNRIYTNIEKDTYARIEKRNKSIPYNASPQTRIYAEKSNALIEQKSKVDMDYLFNKTDEKTYSSQVKKLNKEKEKLVKDIKKYQKRLD